jgi:hypothetical protein
MLGFYSLSFAPSPVCCRLLAILVPLQERWFSPEDNFNDATPAA